MSQMTAFSRHSVVRQTVVSPAGTNTRIFPVAAGAFPFSGAAVRLTQR